MLILWSFFSSQYIAIGFYYDNKIYKELSLSQLWVEKLRSLFNLSYIIMQIHTKQ